MSLRRPSTAPSSVQWASLRPNGAHLAASLTRRQDSFRRSRTIWVPGEARPERCVRRWIVDSRAGDDQLTQQTSHPCACSRWRSGHLRKQFCPHRLPQELLRPRLCNDLPEHQVTNIYSFPGSVPQVSGMRYDRNADGVDRSRVNRSTLSAFGSWSASDAGSTLPCA